MNGLAVRDGGISSKFSEALNGSSESLRRGSTVPESLCGIIPFALWKVGGILSMEWLNALQWPAMIVSFAAAWLVASQKSENAIGASGFFYWATSCGPRGAGMTKRTR